jgi:hypothetical protein
MTIAGSPTSSCAPATTRLTIPRQAARLPSAGDRGGLILLTDRADQVGREFYGPVGIFGIIVTAGLLTYELNGIRRCRELITDGKALEEDLDLQHGQFKGRSQAAFSFMTKPFAAALIYPAVLAAWTYLVFFPEDSCVARTLACGPSSVGSYG